MRAPIKNLKDLREKYEELVTRTEEEEIVMEEGHPNTRKICCVRTALSLKREFLHDLSLVFVEEK